MQALGWAVFGTALLLVVLHRDAAKAYLRAYEGVHGHRNPGASWIVRRDANPEVERLRRRRLLLFVPASLGILLSVVLIVYAPR